MKYAKTVREEALKTWSRWGAFVILLFLAQACGKAAGKRSAAGGVGEVSQIQGVAALRFDLGSFQVGRDFRPAQGPGLEQRNEASRATSSPRPSEGGGGQKSQLLRYFSEVPLTVPEVLPEEFKISGVALRARGVFAAGTPGLRFLKGDVRTSEDEKLAELEVFEREEISAHTQDRVWMVRGLPSLDPKLWDQNLRLHVEGYGRFEEEERESLRIFEVGLQRLQPTLAIHPLQAPSESLHLRGERSLSLSIGGGEEENWRVVGAWKVTQTGHSTLEVTLPPQVSGQWVQTGKRFVGERLGDVGDAVSVHPLLRSLGEGLVLYPASLGWQNEFRKHRRLAGTSAVRFLMQPQEVREVLVLARMTPDFVKRGIQASGDFRRQEGGYFGPLHQVCHSGDCLAPLGLVELARCKTCDDVRDPISLWVGETWEAPRLDGAGAIPVKVRFAALPRELDPVSLERSMPVPLGWSL